MEDLLVVAALRRALDNLQGMAVMVDQRNIFCGMPIVRFQLDTAMTLFGRTLVSDVDDYVTHMAEGKKRSDYSDRDKKRMSDAYLHKQLAIRYKKILGHYYQDISELYSETSSFVHFSTHHLHRVLDIELFKNKKQLALLPHSQLAVGWPEEELRVALCDFCYGSHIIIEECKEWESKWQPIGRVT